MLRLKEPLNLKLSRLSGRLMVSRLSFALHPKVKLLRSGKTRPSKLWLKPPPKVKVWRLLGNITRHRLSPASLLTVCKVRLISSASCGKAALSAKLVPRVKLWRFAGKVKFWLYAVPKLKFWRCLGRITCSRLWSKQLSATKASCWRLHGKATFSRLWLNNLPKFKAHKLSGKFTPARLWLNLRPNVKFRRAVGRVTWSKFLGRVVSAGIIWIIPFVWDPEWCQGPWMPKWGKAAAVAAEKHRIYGKQTWHWGHSTTFITIDLLKVVMFRVKIYGQILSWTSPRCLSKDPPKVSCWRLLGKLTPSRLASYWNPKVKLWSWHGSTTFLKLCLKWYPKVKVSRLLGNVTPTRVESKYWPKVKCNLGFVSEPF